MKKVFNHTREVLLTASLLLLSFVFMSGNCDKDEDNKDPNAYTLSGNGNAAQENNPNNTSTATGTLTGTYNKSTNKLVYNINWTGLTGTAAALHFHGPALAGVNAGVAVGLTITNSAATGGASGEITLTEAQEADLLSGKWYWNVHTATYPGGEVRGQVAATQ
ncbi:MAG TPA: CHRD domain-containing protein [Chitinophagaceae bacterium]|nr:CHRD domain-containing protein [Chitinophagaceae bacterium]